VFSLAEAKRRGSEATDVIRAWKMFRMLWTGNRKQDKPNRTSQGRFFSLRFMDLHRVVDLLAHFILDVSPDDCF
jgi:hypothetical protein